MRPRAGLFLPLAAVLLALAAGSGRLLEEAREEAGIVPSAARLPLGGFEPLVVDLLHLRGEIYLQSRRLPEAVAAIRLATELQPRVPDYWAQLGSVFAWEYARTDAPADLQWKWAREGIMMMRRGLQMNPDSPQLLFALGFLYHRRVAIFPELAALAERDLGELPSKLARDMFKRYLEIDPLVYARWEYARTGRLLGERLEARGRPLQALDAYREALGPLLTLVEDPEAGEAVEILAFVKARIEALEAR